MKTLLLCLLTASLVGCSGGTSNESDRPADADEPTGMAYPSLYRDLELPELPGGRLVSAGRQTTSLRDGLSLRVTTSMSISEVRDYYSQALRDSGWEEAPSRVIPGAPMAGLQATRDGINYTATIMGMGGETQINITVVER